MPRPNYYDVLGVTSKAPQEIIAAVYHAWMFALKAHPDLGGDESLAKSINIAYETLKDPVKRASYDSKIALTGKVEEGKRRSPRVSINVRIGFCIPPSGKWQPAQAVDASSLGLKFLTNEDLFEGMHVAVAFPSSASQAIEAFVRWSKPLKAGSAWKMEVGIEFFHPVPDFMRRLNN